LCKIIKQLNFSEGWEPEKNFLDDDGTKCLALREFLGEDSENDDTAGKFIVLSFRYDNIVV
jgi:hypothetical protein